MLRSKWLSLVLDVTFMTFTILKLKFSFVFLEFIIYLRASSQNIEENHQFKCNLSYIHLFNMIHLLAHHLHCLLKFVDFHWSFLLS